MAACANCGTTILFGGETKGDERFCNETCLKENKLHSHGKHIPIDLIAETAMDIHNGKCPKCRGRGPVDVQYSHTVWSAIILTRWESQREICCKSCGNKIRFVAMLQSLCIGWWGFPWGLIMTPVQVVRNIAGMFKGIEKGKLSPELMAVAHDKLSRQAMRESRKPKKKALKQKVKQSSGLE